MSAKPPVSGLRVLVAVSLVAAVLGSIHAFSVFLAPLEARFGASRSAVSLTYSMGLMALTLAVLFGAPLFGRWPASRVILLSCGMAALGAALAALASSLTVVWLGYSVIFGVANGLGYGFGLQIAARVNPGREGMAMGVVTASYAFGAVLSPGLFDLAIRSGGFALAMWALCATLAAVGVLSAGMMRQLGPPVAAAGGHTAPTSFANAAAQPLLWLGYFGGVLAGLMVIGHAAGIAEWLRPDTAAWLAPVVIAGCNLAGALVAGHLADRIALKRLLVCLALFTTIALLILAGLGRSGGLLPGFGLLGFAYGGTIAAYPAAVAKLFGIEASARVYGRIFTAWGAAGLLGPWFAGYLFDQGAEYGTALLTAACFGLFSAGMITLVFAKVRTLAKG